MEAVDPGSNQAACARGLRILSRPGAIFAITISPKVVCCFFGKRCERHTHIVAAMWKAEADFFRRGVI